MSEMKSYIDRVIAASQSEAAADNALTADELASLVVVIRSFGYSLAEARAFAAGVNSAVAVERKREARRVGR